MVIKKCIQVVTGGLSILLLVSACSSGGHPRKATNTSARTSDTTVLSSDPTDRMTSDRSAVKTERPVAMDRQGAGDRDAMPRDRIVPCADDKGDTTASLDCDQMNRDGRRSGDRTRVDRTRVTDSSLAEACASHRDAQGNLIYDDPACPDRYRGMAAACSSHVDAKGNVVYDDPACAARVRRQMGSSYENVRWTQESAFYDRYADKAVKHAREAEMAAEQGHMPEMLRHAELSLDQAKEAQRVGNQPDLNAGIMALRDSIILGQSHQDPGATAAIRDARIKLSRAAGIDVRDTRTPGERATLTSTMAGLHTRTVKGELARDMNSTRTEGGEHYVLRDRQNKEMPIALSPEMSRQVHVGDIVEAQIDSKGQVVAITPSH